MLTLARPAVRALVRLGMEALSANSVAFTGVWDALDPALPVGSRLAEGGHPAVVRFGRALPLSPPVPVVHLLAIDVLEHELRLVSVGRGPLGSRVPLPVRDLRDATFSTVIGGGPTGIRAPVVAEVHGPGPASVPELRDAERSELEVQLFLASGGHFGRVRLGTRRSDRS